MNKELTAGEVKLVELSDYKQLTAVLLKGQVAQPLEDLWHLLVASVKRRRGRCATSSMCLRPKKVVLSKKATQTQSLNQNDSNKRCSVMIS